MTGNSIEAIVVVLASRHEDSLNEVNAMNPRNHIDQNAQAGLVLVEAMSSMVVVALSMLGLSLVIINCQSLDATVREELAAHNAGRAALESLRNSDLSARFTEEITKTQTVNTTARPVAEFEFPALMLDTSVDGATSTSTLQYKDIDADGRVDLVPGVAARAALLPVEVKVRWVGRGRMRTTTLRTLVTQK
jgi:Tfp pilus assembly protein PilV